MTFKISDSLTKTVSGLNQDQTQNLLKNNQDLKTLLASISYIPVEGVHGFRDSILSKSKNINVQVSQGTAEITLDNMTVLRHAENFNNLFRSVLTYATNNFKESSLNGMALIQDILEKNRFFEDRQGYETHTVVSGWGSHRGSMSETLRKIVALSKVNALENNLLYITGGGDDVMSAVLEGAYRANKQWPRWGYNEPGIVGVEPPNKFVGGGNLIIYPNIDLRKIGFITTSHALQQFEGGVGTQEELMDFLQVLLHDKNRDVPYLYDVILHDQEYFKTLKKFLYSFLTPEQVDKRLDMHLRPNPKKFAEFTNKKILKNLPEKKPLFQKDLYIPTHMFENDDASNADFHELLSNLDLTKNQSQQELIRNIGKFFNYFVSLTIKVPETAQEWIDQNDLPQINIDADIKTALEDLIKLFIKQRRVYITEDQIFYRFKTV